MKKVKCIAPHRELQLGDIYTVVLQFMIGNSEFYNLEGLNENYFTRRFEVVSEDQPITTSKYANKECPCGLSSIDCEYHK